MKPATFRRLLNFYPPYLGAGVHVDWIAENWKEMQVSMACRWYNRNYVGTHFGGSLYSMVDPHLMLLMIQLLGKEYIVWDKQADIEFVKATKRKVSARISISDSDILQIKAQTANGEKYLPEFVISIRDEEGALIAQVKKTLYIRKKQARK